MKLDNNEITLIEERVKLLENFSFILRKLFDGKIKDEKKEKSKTFINKNLIAVKNAVIEAGTLKRTTISPPPAVGGMVAQNLNPFDNLFTDFWGRSLIPTAIESIEQAIGVYEHIKNETGLIKLNHKEAIDIESAIERALRPSFRDRPPTKEKDVQDAIENILNAIGIVFTRDKEVAPVGPKAFRPDFIIQNMNLAIEVKLARESHPASKI